MRYLIPGRSVALLAARLTGRDFVGLNCRIQGAVPLLILSTRGFTFPTGSPEGVSSKRLCRKFGSVANSVLTDRAVTSR